MKSFFIFIFFLTIKSTSTFSEEGKKSFKNYKILRVWLHDEEQLKFIKALEESQMVNIWAEFRPPGHMDIMVSPSVFENLKRYLERTKTRSEILIEDLQTSVDAEWTANEEARQQDRAEPYTYYARYDAILSWFDTMAATYPALAKVYKLGETYEGRQMVALRVGRAVSDSSTTRPVILVDACTHAREWLGCASEFYIINKFLTTEQSNPDISNVLNKFDWWFVPVANPDGYEYTFTNYRYWRKTRKPNIGSSCIGTDMNRNFDAHWSEPGASGSPCSDTYYGDIPFSEPESLILAQLMEQLKPKMYINIHTYSQLILTPWGYTSRKPPTYTEIMRVANIGRNTLIATGGQQWTAGNTYDTIYPASGLSIDYAYDTAGVAYSWTIELRPGPNSGLNGFSPPPSYIEPSGREVLAMFIATANAMA